METKRSATIFHAKNVLAELTSKLQYIKSQQEDIKKKAVRVYFDLVKEVKLLVKSFINEKKAGSDSEIKNIIKNIKNAWSEIEKMIFGPVIIVTRTVSFFKSQKKLWEGNRRIELAESLEEALNLAAEQKPDYGERVSYFIVDANSYTRDELERFAETVKITYGNKIPVLIVGKLEDAVSK